MAGNQQFCLRWNNHQSTLVSVFDTLLESGTLVDCTLAAEGQYLRAHKVVLSACSPYLEALLSQHYEKHPIIILKDVTFIELKAMLDYMYRGEVNISQDQLGTFLKAAESLHIKGLTDNSGGGGGGGGPGPAPDYPPVKKSSESQRKSYNPPPRSKSPAFPQGLIVEPRPYKSNTPGVLAGANNNNNNNNTENNNSGLRDGSVSPKRSKRRRSCSGDDSSTMGLALVKSECGAGGGGSGGGGDSMTETVAAPSALVHCSIAAPDSNSSAAAPGPSPDCPVKLEPRSDEYNNEDSADDKHPYDDDDDDDPVESRPGTSHATNSHASGVWNASADASAEDMFAPGGPQDQEASYERYPPKLLSRPLVASLKAVNTYMARLNTTVTVPHPGQLPAHHHHHQHQQQQQQGLHQQQQQQQQRSSIQCPNCHKCYSSQHTLRRHMRLECGKEPQFHCPYCPRKTKQRYNLMLHIARAHKPDQTLQYKN